MKIQRLSVIAESLFYLTIHPMFYIHYILYSVGKLNTRQKIKILENKCKGTMEYIL